MNREIKFRAWDSENKKMLHIGKFTIYHEKDNGLHSGKENKQGDWYNLPLMQFTGLKDKNGKKIYDGDIVKWGHLKGSEENPIRIAIVKIEPDIKFEIVNYKTDFAGQNRIFHYGSFAYKNTNNCLEIIGNIFENTELLDGSVVA